MRLCRVEIAGKPEVALYGEERLVPLARAADVYAQHTGRRPQLPASDLLVDFLPPAGPGFGIAREIEAWVVANPSALPESATIATEAADLMVPIGRPSKIFLLAGNYAEHIQEGGEIAAERAETFPYVFMKPPTTTLTEPGRPIRIPSISPGAIDWELELAVIIGKTGKRVAECDALALVAGYTIINDISNRKFRPNPGRKKRDKDAFFDWMHGKWFDSFCPCGPCITSADAIPDPQCLAMELRVNGEIKQNSSTARQIFPVAALIEFISSFVTLEPGDIISTGTPAGVGSSTGTFLKPGDVMTGRIDAIGTLRTPVAAE